MAKKARFQPGESKEAARGREAEADEVRWKERLKKIARAKSAAEEPSSLLRSKPKR
jgi:hypothetical protein